MLLYAAVAIQYTHIPRLGLGAVALKSFLQRQHSRGKVAVNGVFVITQRKVGCDMYTCYCNDEPKYEVCAARAKATEGSLWLVSMPRPKMLKLCRSGVLAVPPSQKFRSILFAHAESVWGTDSAKRLSRVGSLASIPEGIMSGAASAETLPLANDAPRASPTVTYAPCACI